MADQGIFIVLEGSDGSGKTTQFEMLQKRLTDAGYDIETFDFPRYDKSSSYFITRYLNGAYGPAANVNPYTASLFYALDRFEAGPDIRKALEAGKIVLSNRYVGSNMAHQGSKFHGAIEKRSFFVWEDSLEYQLLGIPRPHLNLYLRVPAEVSFELIGKKQARSYTDKSHDQHEADLDHLKRSVETYDLLCQLFPRDFHAIECVDSGKLMSVKEISDVIWSSLKPLLPPMPKQLAAEAEAEPKAKPEPAPAKAKPPKAAPAEFNWRLPQLSRLAAIDIMTKLLPLDVKSEAWGGGKSGYKYFVPEGLSVNLDKKYRRTMDTLINLHKQAGAHKDESGQLKRAVPMAAMVSAEMAIHRDSAAEVVRRLSLSKNDEVRSLATGLVEKLSATWPDVNAEIDEFEKQQKTPEAIGDIIEKLAGDILPKPDDDEDQEPVTLVTAFPRNEFELLAQSLEPYSEMPLTEISARIAGWDYQQKAKALEIALAKADSHALQTASYRFGLLTPWMELEKMLASGLFSDVQIQRTKSGAGRVADEEPGPVADSVRQIRDKSAELATELKAEYDSHILDYCALSGDQVSWQTTITAGKLATAKVGDAMGELLDAMKELTQEAHPIIGEHLMAAQKQPKTAKPRRNSRPKKS